MDSKSASGWEKPTRVDLIRPSAAGMLDLNGSLSVRVMRIWWGTEGGAWRQGGEVDVRAALGIGCSCDLLCGKSPQTSAQSTRPHSQIFSSLMCADTRILANEFE